MNIFDYVAYKNPQGASRVVGKYGLRPHNTRQGLAAQLANVTARYKDPVMNDIKDIHPDFNLFSSNEGINSQYETLNEKWANAGGCGCGGSFSNVDGQNLKAETGSRMQDKSELLITGGLLLIGLALVLKLTKG